MPIINLEGPEMTRETKARFIKEMTSKASEILNIPEQAFTVIIHENPADNIGVGGKLLSELHKK